MEGYFAYEKKNGEITILRCYGSSGSVVIPEELEGLPVTELSAYAFAGEISQEPENTGGFPCICGNRLEEVYLPPTIRRLGRYIFYNCLQFRKLSFYSNIAFMGAGAFTGCENLSCLEMYQLDGKSCLREILQDLKQKVTVDCYSVVDGKKTDIQHSTGSMERIWRLVYPEFFEEAVENTPARIISTQTHGMGIQYRNAFANTQVVFSEYDRLFHTGKYNIDLRNIIDMSISRLRFSFALDGKARDAYAKWLSGHLREAALFLLEQEDMENLRWLIESFVTEAEQIEVVLEEAKRLEAVQAVSVIMDVKHQRFATKKKRFCL